MKYIITCAIISIFFISKAIGQNIHDFIRNHCNEQYQTKIIDKKIDGSQLHAYHTLYDDNKCFRYLFDYEIIEQYPTTVRGLTITHVKHFKLLKQTKKITHLDIDIKAFRKLLNRNRISQEVLAEIIHNNSLEYVNLFESKPNLCKKTSLAPILSFLGNVSSLKILTIDIPRLSVLPEEVSKMESLEKIIIHSSNLTQLNDGLVKLNNLQTLEIYSSELGHFPESILQLDQLEKLVLAGPISYVPKHNRTIETVVFDSIRMKKKLLKFDSKENEGIGYRFIAKNNKIKTLPSSFNNLKKLRHLEIYSDSLMLLPVALQKLTQLYYFTISAPNLTTIEASFDSLPALNHLNLGHLNNIGKWDDVPSGEIVLYKPEIQKLLNFLIEKKEKISLHLDSYTVGSIDGSILKPLNGIFSINVYHSIENGERFYFPPQQIPALLDIFTESSVLIEAEHTEDYRSKFGKLHQTIYSTFSELSRRRHDSIISLDIQEADSSILNLLTQFKYLRYLKIRSIVDNVYDTISNVTNSICELNNVSFLEISAVRNLKLEIPDCLTNMRSLRFLKLDQLINTDQLIQFENKELEGLFVYAFSKSKTLNSIGSITIPPLKKVKELQIFAGAIHLNFAEDTANFKRLVFYGEGYNRRGDSPSITFPVLKNIESIIFLGYPKKLLNFSSIDTLTSYSPGYLLTDGPRPVVGHVDVQTNQPLPIRLPSLVNSMTLTIGTNYVHPSFDSIKLIQNEPLIYARSRTNVLSSLYDLKDIPGYFPLVLNLGNIVYNTYIDDFKYLKHFDTIIFLVTPFSPHTEILDRIKAHLPNTYILTIKINSVFF